MNIAVIAASGRSGQAFVERALGSGHSVRAGVRGESRLKPHANLKIIKCDATNIDDLKILIEGQDAVASFIGHVKGSNPDVQTKATQYLIDAMRSTGMRRVVSLTGTGVRFPGDKISLTDRFLNLSIGIIDPLRIKDGKDHVKLLLDSELDWTILRVLKLQNTSLKDFALTENGPTKKYVSRQEVAVAVLEVLEDASFIRKAPIISRIPK